MSALSWMLDDDPRIIGTILGPSKPLPDAICWGSSEYPATRPLWVWVAPSSIGRCCERVWRVHPQDSILLLGVPNDETTWRRLWHMAPAMPLGTSILVVSEGDFHKKVARRVGRNPEYR